MSTNIGLSTIGAGEYCCTISPPLTGLEVDQIADSGALNFGGNTRIEGDSIRTEITYISSIGSRRDRKDVLRSALNIAEILEKSRRENEIFPDILHLI